jgi:hypothetical protein
MRVHSTHAQLSTAALFALDCVCLARGAGPILCSSASAVLSFGVSTPVSVQIYIRCGPLLSVVRIRSHRMNSTVQAAH